MEGDGEFAFEEFGFGSYFYAFHTIFVLFAHTDTGNRLLFAIKKDIVFGLFEEVLVVF